MNNGDGQNNSNFPVNDLSLTGPNPVVNHEKYTNDMQRLQDLKAYLSAYEDKLNAGYAKFRDDEERRRLEETVRQGQLAAQLLAEMQGGREAAPAPTQAVAGPSNIAQPSAFTSVFPAQGGTSYNEVPSSAQIVEVPPSQESPKHDRTPTRSSARISARAEAQAAASQAQASQAASQPQAAPSRPRAPRAAPSRPQVPKAAPSRPQVPAASYHYPQGYQNTYIPYQDWTAFGASPSVMYGYVPPPGAHTQQASYQTAQWTAPQVPTPQVQFSHYRPHAYYPGVQAQAPPAAPSTSRSAPQPHHAGSQQQADRAPQREPVASGSSQPVGASSSSVSTQVRVDGVNRSNVVQSSESASRPSQPSASGQTQQPVTIPQFQQQQLFQYLQKYPIPEAQILIQQTLRAVRRKQTGRVKTAAELEVERTLNASLVKYADVVADYLKVYPESEIKEVFKKYLIFASRQQQAAARPGGSTNSNQKPQQQVPSVSTFTPQSAPPPQPNGASAQHPATIQLPVPQPATKPSSSATPAPGPSTAAPTATSSVTTASSTSNANGAGGPLTQISWYTPRDPTAPIMVRNAQGQIQWVHRNAVPQSAVPPASAQPQVPSTPPASKAAAAPQPELSATPQPRPAPGPAAWTPDKADRSRLAQDIMRSLGRPKGAFGTPLSPTDTLSAPPFEVIHPSTVTATSTSTPTPTPTATAAAKRKASLARSSPISPTAAKRPRLDGGQDAQSLVVAAAVGGTSEAAAMVEVVAPGVDGEHEVELPAGVAAPERAVKREAEEDGDMDHVDAATLPPAAVDVDVPGHGLLPGLHDADTVRGVSITSSEAANIDRVLDVATSEPEPEPIADGVPPVYVDRAGQGSDDVLHATSSPLQEFSVAASNATPPPSSPAPSLRDKGKGKEREKVPLFLPSPSGSPEPSEVSPVPRLPGGRKGKGRALDADLELQQLADEDEDGASEVSSVAPPRKRRRTNRAYVLAPPLPEYAASLQGNEIVWWGSQPPSSPASVASGSRYGTPSVGGSAGASRPASRAGEEDESEDELAEWHADEEVGLLAESESEADGEEAEAAAQLAFSRLRETPCSWDGCGVVLNSMATLQKHVVLHAGENSEWGTFTCQWKGCLSHSFKDEQSLVRHLQKQHARSPLLCAYEGCDRSFGSASDLLHHHQSGKHRDEQLRKSCYPAPPPENRRQLSPLPDVLPMYMFAVRPVRRHPISRDRHQWVGPKVLENITSFKYTGRRSHAGQPSRLSRRLAEKVVAVELASVTPESGHAQIRRWIDDEYLDFADGYDASRRFRVWCADIPAGEVTQMVHDGLALFVDGDGVYGASGGEEDVDRGADGGLGGGGQERSSYAEEGTAPAAEEEEGSKEPSLPPRSGEGSPASTNAEEGQKPTIRLKLTLPRRSNVIRLPARGPNRTEGVLHRDGDGPGDANAVAGNPNSGTLTLPNPDQLDGSKTPPPAALAPQSSNSVRRTPTSTPQLPEPTGAPSPQRLVSVPEPSTGEVLGSAWTVWPPAKEESVETH